jgi:hypothetical protein
MASLIPSANASGTGSMTLAGPSTNSNQTVTIPDTTGTMMVSGNMPAFSVYCNTNPSVTSGVFTKVPLQVENFDTASCFNNTGSTVGSIPAYAFLPNVAGYYQISAAISANSANTRFLTNIYKNGSRAFVLGDAPTGFNTLGGSALIYMNGSTDYIELYVYLVGASQSVYGVSDSTWMNGLLVRTA